MMTGSRGGQQINDLFDRFVSPMIGGLEAAVGSVLRIGSVVEAAYMSQRVKGFRAVPQAPT